MNLKLNFNFEFIDNSVNQGYRCLNPMKYFSNYTSLLFRPANWNALIVISLEVNKFLIAGIQQNERQYLRVLF
jgi:hypothetical protein